MLQVRACRRLTQSEKMKSMADHEQTQDDHSDSQDDAETNKPSPLKNPRVRIILLLVLAAAVIGGVLWYVRYQSVGKFMQATDDAYIQADAVTIAPKVSGYVDQVFVADNQAVKAGQPLLRIDAATIAPRPRRSRRRSMSRGRMRRACAPRSASSRRPSPRRRPI